MEFKGTSGNWVLLTGFKSCGISIGNRHTMVFSNDSEEDKANALLISKAPEMLEMLKHVLALAECGNIVEAYKVEKLIKEATELNI